jgi:hypothetical protein
MVEQRIHSSWPLQIVTPIEGGIEGRCRGTARPPPQKSVVEQGSPGGAPTLRLVFELTEIEFTVETTFEHGQARRHDVKHGRPKRTADHAPEDHAFDEESDKFRAGNFDRVIDRTPKLPGLPRRRLVT